MIAQTIQLALAPVFVLVAIGNIMNLLSTRLGRIVDRSRHLQELHTATSGPDHDAVVVEMRAIARRMLGQDEAEDAVQEILLVVHGVRHTYEPGRPFRPWLSTIATRRCIDILRRHQREGLRVGDALAVEAQVDEAPDPLARLEQVQRGERLHAAVAGLSPGQRDAVRLLHLQELSLREAEAHGRQRAGALKVASHRALKALRRALQGDEDAR